MIKKAKSLLSLIEKCLTLCGLKGTLGVEFGYYNEIIQKKLIRRIISNGITLTRKGFKTYFTFSVDHL